MKNKIIAALLLACFTTTTIARAQEPAKLPEIVTPKGEVDPGEAISPMNKEQKAPFSGVLLSPKAVAKLTVELKNIDKKVELEVNRAVEIQKAVCLKDTNDVKIKLETDKKILMASLEERMRTIKIYDEQLKKESNRPDAGTLVGLGAAGGAILTVLAVLAFSQAK